MPFLAAKKAGERIQASPPQSYPSQALALILEGLSPQGGDCMLDVGPVCQENLNFFASRVLRLYVCDLFHRLHLCLAQDEPPEQAMEDLDYPPGCFARILLWNLPDHLESPQVARLVEHCRRLAAPGGLIMICAAAERRPPSQAFALVTSPGPRLTPRVQPHLRLPFHIRPNREVLAVMEPLRPLKSYVYRDGYREFLFANP